MSSTEFFSCIEQGGPEEKAVAAAFTTATGVRGVGKEGLGRVARARRSQGTRESIGSFAAFTLHTFFVCRLAIFQGRKVSRNCSSTNILSVSSAGGSDQKYGTTTWT